MNLAAVLPSFLQVDYQPRHARVRSQATCTEAPQRCTLPNHAIITLPNRRLQLQVLHGRVWITRDGCLADVVLSAGDRFEQEPGTPVLVQAFGEVELMIAGAHAHADND